MTLPLNQKVATVKARLHSINLQLPLDAADATQILALIDLYACQEQWEKVLDLSSRAISAGCGHNATVRFYRSWIEALKELHEVEALQTMAAHLLRHRDEREDFLALAGIALSYSGRRNYARVVSIHLRRLSSFNTTVSEALGIFACESLAKNSRNAGVAILKKVAFKSKNFFQLKSYFEFALENDCEEDASLALNYMSQYFPYYKEPTFTMAHIYIAESKYEEAYRTLRQLEVHHPNCGDTLLLIALCQEKMGGLEEARDLLLMNEYKFGQGSYEFHLAVATLSKKLHANSAARQYKLDAKFHYIQALTIAQKLNISEAPIKMALNSLYEKQTQTPQNFWLLSADKVSLKSIVKNNQVLIPAPEGVSQGDVVWVGKADAKGKHTVTGMYWVASPVVNDSVHGPTVKLSNGKVLNETVEIAANKDMIPTYGLNGQFNFSSNGVAHFFQLNLDLVEYMIGSLEKTLGTGHKRSNYGKQVS